ncbi:hypothetical protein EIP86_007773 [Pleurotus ostreatoroseus]|nr:hypothetical protein EIP86_007773 [Pleurotus ostreatoroseus]
MASYLSTLLWGTSQLDEAIDKATSEMLPSGSEDIALNLEISDQIRSKSVPAKDAMRSLKRRLGHKNPNVQLLALGLTDTCVKNGGDLFLVEIASREFMDNLTSILKQPGLNTDVKNKMLRLIQNWAISFEGKINLGYVGEVYRILQNEGFNFPPRDLTAATSAMVDTQTAPEWIDSDVCLRCRTAFTFTNRKHHCRNCGQVFDQQCSSKSMALPHFGITQEVRVCDSCYTKLNKKTKSHRSSQSVSSSRHRSARDFADTELQRAIQLSLEEVGAAGTKHPGYVPSPSPWQTSEPPLVDRGRSNGYSSQNRIDEEDDPDLRAAIEASLQEANAPRPSAPMGIETPRTEEPGYAYNGYSQSYPPSSATPKPTIPALPNYDLEPLEEDAILTFSQTVEQLQQQGGRDLSRYPAVTELYDKANGLRPKLAMNLSDTGRKEELLSEMHEKLSQAVKLYDKLLTEQVSHPPWRASTQPAPAGYAPQYQATSRQWSQPTAASPQIQSAQPSYFPPQAQPAAPERQASLPATGVYATSPTNEAYAHQMYQAPQQSQQYAAPTPPVSVPQYAPAPVAPVTSPPVQSPISQPQSILPPVQAAPALPTYATSPPPPVNAQTKYLTRSNTLSHTHAQSQLQQLQQTSVPNFPVAPTNVPQVYQSYASPAPSEAEQREALLIDL